MRYCPPEYYDNCSNAVLKCNKCRAGYGTLNNKLLYKPIVTTDINNQHPMLQTKVKSNSSIKDGFKQETQVVSSWIKQTLKSGSILGDGDIKVGDLKLDVKTRSNTKSFTVKANEYTIGLKKGYDGWVIVNKDKQRLVCLTEDSFLKLTGKLLDEISNL